MRIVKRTYEKSDIAFYYIEYKFLFFWFRPKRINNRRNIFFSEKEVMDFLEKDDTEESPSFNETIVKYIKEEKENVQK